MIKTISSYFIWVFFAVCNLCVVALMDVFSPDDWGALFVYWCFGMLAAQAGLVAIWFALWPERLLRRMIRCFVVAAVLYLCWAIGYVGTYLANRYPSDPNSLYQLLVNVSEEVLLALFCLPAYQLAIQSPLWFARAVLQWRIEQQGRWEPASRQANVTIRGLLIGTALVAFSLAVARSSLSYLSGGSREEAWIVLGIGVLVAAGVGLASLPLALIAFLRARSPWVGGLSFIAYASVVTAIVLGVLWLSGMPFWGSDLWRMCGIFCSVLSLATGLGLVLLGTRRRGFRLRWGRERPEVAPTTQLPPVRSAMGSPKSP
jgi:hypothetical protein